MLCLLWKTKVLIYFNQSTNRAGKETVHRIFEQALHRLDSNGELFVVIQKKQGMPSAKKRMNELFGNVEVVNKDKGYYILRSIKA